MSADFRLKGQAAHISESPMVAVFSARQLLLVLAHGVKDLNKPTLCLVKRLFYSLNYSIIASQTITL